MAGHYVIAGKAIPNHVVRSYFWYVFSFVLSTVTVGCSWQWTAMYNQLKAETMEGSTKNLLASPVTAVYCLRRGVCIYAHELRTLRTRPSDVVTGYRHVANPLYEMCVPVRWSAQPAHLSFSYLLFYFLPNWQHHTNSPYPFTARHGIHWRLRCPWRLVHLRI